MTMAGAKRVYNVYLRQIIDDWSGDPALAIKYESFIGRTMAVSAAQAANNVRFRRGESYNYISDRYGEAFYYAVADEDDVPELHANFNDWEKTH